MQHWEQVKIKHFLFWGKMEFITLEYHPNDSRIRIEERGICQTLNTRMGTGGGNVPLVLEIYEEDADGETVL